MFPDYLSVSCDYDGNVNTPKSKIKLCVKIMNEVFLRALMYFQNCESPLYDKNSHEWKIIPLNLLNRYLGKNFNFHSNF